METRETRPMKVLHAPFNFANQPYILNQALRARGVDSHLLRYQWEGNANATKFQYGEDRVAQISRLDWFGDLLRNVQNVAAEGFDIVHFWNRSLLWRHPSDFFNGIDLPFIRQAGPRLAYRFTGYELRRKSLEIKVNPYTPYRYGYESRFREDDQQRYLDYLASYVDTFVVQDPEMQTYCPQARIIPRALDLAQFPDTGPETLHENKRVVVAHAPSHQKLKGSEFAIQAIETLREEGLDFDFVLIENMPNAEALAQYRRADIIIDQLLIGWYGVLSMEAMAMGKTVIVYIRDDLRGYFQGEPPLLNANPDTITSILRSAIKDAELRREVGRRGRAFVEVVHDSKFVAEAAEHMYNDLLRAPICPAIPDLSYQISKSVDFVTVLNAPVRIRELSRSLRARTRQVAELNKELPGLRYRAKRYDELKDEIVLWRAKAERYDRLAATRPGRLLLRLFGFGSPPRSRPSQHSAAGMVSGSTGGGNPSRIEVTIESKARSQSSGPDVGQLNEARLPAADGKPSGKQTQARPRGPAVQPSVMTEMRAILRLARDSHRRGGGTGAT